MKVQRFVLGMFETNGYIIYGKRPSECVLIDPAGQSELLEEFLEKKSLMPVAVLLTHGHYDHILAVPALQKKWIALPVYCHPLDCPEELQEKDIGMVFPTVTCFQNLCFLEDGQALTLAGFEIKVMCTPGHTPGSVTFFIEDAMFTGDTLFRGSIGRTDFAGGNEKDMVDSLRRLASVTGDYRVYPGHEDVSTLDQEKQFNPYLKLL